VIFGKWLTVRKGLQTLLNSMTGYGRGFHTTTEYNITIDIKSVNHRYLDLYFKIPKPYAFLEEKLRRIITGKINRGKLDITVNIEKTATPDVRVELNRAMITAYLAAIRELQTDYQLPDELNIQSLLSLPDLFITTQPEEDQEQLTLAASQALEPALTALLHMREAEGRQLAADLKQKLSLLRQYYQSLTAAAPLVVTTYREKLTKRLDELAGEVDVDPNRLAQEVAIFADRSDISEELVRLESHLQQFLMTLELSKPVGRKLDFLIQELNREINTIGSKANDLQIAQIVINFKTELEKLREQIQNLE
jgi:uncharacterized protein (TIGR00255 family)